MSIKEKKTRLYWLCRWINYSHTSHHNLPSWKSQYRGTGTNIRQCAGRYIKSLSRSIENTPSSICGPWETEKSPYHMPIFIAGGGNTHRSLFLFFRARLVNHISKASRSSVGYLHKAISTNTPLLTPAAKSIKKRNFSIFFTFFIT